MKVFFLKWFNLRFFLGLIYSNINIYFDLVENKNKIISVKLGY